MADELVTITKEEHFYLVTFYSDSNEAVDSWLTQVEQLHRMFTPADYVAYKIVVLPGKAPSLGYVMKAARQSMRRSPNRPTTRTALMYRLSDAPMLGVLDMFLRWLTYNPRDAVAFFREEQDAEADQWLRRED